MENLQKIQMNFREIYKREPRVFRAPGRVNLIGEHTDYNDGFVLPFAIDRNVLFAGARREDTKINVQALDIQESFSFDLRDEAVRRRGTWIDYVEGTIRCLQKRFALTKGADLAFSSTVPIGAGLSSSAALEVSAGFAALSLNEIEFDRKELAFAAQKAEHEFVGVNSGIMDQFASALCIKDHALLLDCRSLETRNISLDLPGAMIVVCDTQVKHELGATEYNLRRAECEAGVELLRQFLPEINSLRDVNLEEFLKYEENLPEKIRKRCRHVITENARTLEAAKALQENDLIETGRLMFLSHESLRNDYEVSCAELDTLVDAARTVEGVLGARMTGGGFGGCTVNLIRREVYEKFRETIFQDYNKTYGFEPIIYNFEASAGASEINYTNKTQ